MTAAVTGAAVNGLSRTDHRHFLQVFHGYERRMTVG